MLLLEPTTVTMQAVRRAAQAISVKPKAALQAAGDSNLVSAVCVLG